MRKWIVLLALIALPMLAGDQTHLQIHVMNQNGKAVDNASVIVKFVQGRSISKFGKQDKKEWNLKTNQEGVAKLPSIPQGKVLIQIIAKNYQTFGETYDVNEDEKTIDIKLNPPQAQYTAHPK
jgi:uncharacterized GH25 family protein